MSPASGTIIRNNAKRKLRAGGIAVGFGLHHLRSVAAPALAAATEHDYVSIDMEHGAFTLQEATQLCIAALPAGVAPIVRVCAGALDEGTRLLDNGALGIIVPHVDTAAQARSAADAFLYPPVGHRSWGGPAAVYGYRTPHVAEAQRAINDEILVIVMLESPEAIANADAIAAVPGIDVLLIGSFDLTSEMGIAGQMAHPMLIDAYARVAAACRTHGKVLGLGGISDEADVARYMAMGARFLGSGNDHSYIVEAARARVAMFHRIAAAVPRE
jgi:2-keto-3-deoxy-L-rhamnonate aldolase RhmA